jgi:hypothetical protein
MLQMFSHVIRNDGVMALYRGVRIMQAWPAGLSNAASSYLQRNFAKRPTA